MKLYDLNVVSDYVREMARQEKMIFEVSGSLLDNYFIFHDCAVEFFAEHAINTWSSAHRRHIYKKRVPACVFSWVADAIEYYEEIRELDKVEDLKLLDYLLNDFNADKKAA